MSETGSCSRPQAAAVMVIRLAATRKRCALISPMGRSAPKAPIFMVPAVTMPADLGEASEDARSWAICPRRGCHSYRMGKLSQAGREPAEALIEVGRRAGELDHRKSAFSGRGL